MNAKPPAGLVAVVGWKNSGKTGLVERLVRALSRRGLSVSTLKHAHHDIDLDRPGRDSWRHREAGASEVALVTSSRLVLQRRLGEGEPEPELAEVVAAMRPVDVVLAEGFKAAVGVPKLECWREACAKPPLALRDEAILALAAQGRVPPVRAPVLDLDDTEAILSAILAWTGK